MNTTGEITVSDAVTQLVVQYDKLSKLTKESLHGIKEIIVVFDEKNPMSIMTSLAIDSNGLISRTVQYDSLKEFSTVAMKELLTLYAKKTIINSDVSYYVNDDPRLHSFLSKLSYPGVEAVCQNLAEFSSQFKSGKVTLPLQKMGLSQSKHHN